MRIWDIEPGKLCRSHLLGEHRELHAIWKILTCGKKGYSHHPETLRWKGKLKALFLRHDKLVDELKRRGYRHNSLLDKSYAIGCARQDVFIDSIQRQLSILNKKGCACKVKK
ncbi:MAG: pyrimidine dimer DNA glycosylase [Candidatus Omnitrophica bacterium]|nr:pyrimidine dimer DNA glycosylase [Candidatus Omnitrophota bacterium]